MDSRERAIYEQEQQVNTHFPLAAGGNVACGMQMQSDLI